MSDLYQNVINQKSNDGLLYGDAGRVCGSLGNQFGLKSNKKPGLSAKIIKFGPNRLDRVMLMGRVILQ